MKMKIFSMGKVWTKQEGIDHIQDAKLLRPPVHATVTLGLHNDKKLADILKDCYIVGLCEKPWIDSFGVLRIPYLYAIRGTRKVYLDRFDSTWFQYCLPLGADPQI